MPSVGINLQQNSLPPWLEALYKQLGTLGQKEALAPYLPYTGSRLESFSPDTQRSFDLGRKTGLYEPSLQQAGQQLQQGTQSFPQLYQQYMNPYTNQVVDRIAEEGNRNFTQNILPALESQFVAKGQHASGRHAALLGKMALENQNQITRQQSDALARGYEHGAHVFAQDQGRHMQAAPLYGDMGRFRQAGNLADITALQEQGKMQQGLGQQGKDIAYGDFMRKLQYPQQQLAHFNALLHGIPAPQQTTTYNQVPGTPQVNNAGNLGALAGQLYGMRQMGGYKKGGRVSGYLPRLPKMPSLKRKKPKGIGALMKGGLR
jgi:hypothetical protein